MGKHSKPEEYGSDGKSLEEKAAERKAWLKGGFAAGNTDDTKRGRGNAKGESSR